MLDCESSPADRAASPSDGRAKGLLNKFQISECWFVRRGNSESVALRPPHRGRRFSVHGGMRDRSGYSDQRRNNRAPLVPPKPKEFDIAYSSLALRAWLGTKSMASVSG